eukprot:NODE_4630_length_458_cov_49.151589_g3995_i0.p2 GENE.NODE_4630_length_458_cov_49.151589_g3995_i0~~NODE_4630_length_458_cov_49.151589_g3995_i0.p2  ORF type:complete len:58 (-),score=9.72 NODE_4630_length_458_cov_49.151589_g3995_i0:139-312(-)
MVTTFNTKANAQKDGANERTLTQKPLQPLNTCTKAVSEFWISKREQLTIATRLTTTN